MLPIVGLFPESAIFDSGDATQVRPSLYHQGRGALEKKKKQRFAKASLIRVAAKNRDIYTLLSNMNYRLCRDTATSRYSERLAVKRGPFEQSCRELSKVLRSTPFVRVCGIVLIGPKISYPRGQTIRVPPWKGMYLKLPASCHLSLHRVFRDALLF